MSEIFKRKKQIFKLLFTPSIKLHPFIIIKILTNKKIKLNNFTFINLKIIGKLFCKIIVFVEYIYIPTTNIIKIKRTFGDCIILRSELKPNKKIKKYKIKNSKLKYL